MKYLGFLVRVSPRAVRHWEPVIRKVQTKIVFFEKKIIAHLRETNFDQGHIILAGGLGLGFGGMLPSKVSSLKPPRCYQFLSWASPYEALHRL